ncbi:TPA: hypothetical protein ACH3X2_007799 [Trebouxia sp. C0005]|nr:MAG: hypothetical protein FRX49_06519 [Trebouxia sp. A1-2]
MQTSGKIISEVLPVPALFLHPQLVVNWARGFAREATPEAGQAQSQAKPIKKGLSAGTVPPATEQVPASVEQHPGTAAPNTDLPPGNLDYQKPSSVIKSSATVGRDRPSASTVPAGADQIPPSAADHIFAQSSHGDTSHNDASDEPSTSNPQAQQSMQSVMDDISDIGQVGKTKADSKHLSEDSNMPGTGRWQRFKWWIWGTPQQYWTDQSNTSSTGDMSGSRKAESHAASGSTVPPGDSKVWRRSKYSLGDIIASAILRSGITKDEDIARFASKSAAIAIYTLGGFSLLGTLGVDTKPLVTGLGVGGFTVGFALRDVATNFVSGVLLVLQRPFEKGNRLRVHAGSTILEGEVQSIELRYIVLKPKDQSTIMIPASIVYANPVVVLKQ